MKQLNKILIVDDDSVACFLLERALKKAGVSQHILVANNGEEALQILKQVCLTETCPELILLDINMPVMNGFEFLEALQNSGLAALPLKIILLTSSSNPQDVERAKRYPVAAYLSKPITEDKLKTIMA